MATIRNLALSLLPVTETAARAASSWIGRGEKEQGDGAAVDAMRAALAQVHMRGTVVIGEGEKDEAPMLYNGETVGSGSGPEVDIAVDPVEGTTFMSYGMPGSICVLAAAPKGSMFRPGPAFYMDKLVVPAPARGKIDPAAPMKDKLHALAKALGKDVKELRIFLLKKPRHDGMIKEIQAAGATVRLQTDGDVSGGIMAALGTKVDAMMGIGGTPEGVITACAARAMGADMFGALAPQKPGEAEAIAEAGLKVGQWIGRDELVASDDVLFVATGLTSGDILDGVSRSHFFVESESLVISGHDGILRRVRTHQRADD
ncbi:class II fructose-bisphosphatase [Acidithiobacillus sp. CV18-2]|uniref:Fructose-1,6-bisphosphatase n=1 Tax=Igneacidithiobacillus copahuensis TaxID=2724909 RepID=A0AAE2YNM1_9PROT|nr:class II fructose-bisphosphatase [Igneacidithiobacillus copahuensis]MBU2753816.1 class II fructose-bisphosphatase [Acidithiobacillus sp. CV18-3]MBU2756486.1 class II fructose-bisphosphatase [Acidithiobacillus sp. BN09-2]MBU2776421.1 class II fructose-bisphosphatase [Acidithiobacillus sp. CV18-2]MBU2796324.1 class II fructose-bisphosphatase [Acidithiobacillus sp. VAN18-2]MBU2799131.1 class II fructose-bisphosphatase [Acidithiobacillus sp. VAN18-4]UTV81163.1 class II fructose-bisphosphatase 